MVKRQICSMVACALYTVVMPWSIVTAETSQPEYKVKAATVYKIAKFVSWPTDSFGSQYAPLVLCIAGKDPFGQYIDNLDGQLILGRPMLVRRVADRDLMVRGCHIVFVSQHSEEVAILRALARLPVLTIGDSSQFASIGGMLGLGIVDNRVTFEINLEAAKKARLDISASLLQLATIVTSPPS